MAYQEQTHQDRAHLTLVHSLPEGVLPPESSSIESAPLHSVDNPNRIPTLATLELPALPVHTLPGQAEGKVIDAREAFAKAQHRAVEIATGTNRPLRQKASNLLGKLIGPYF